MLPAEGTKLLIDLLICVQSEYIWNISLELVGIADIGEDMVCFLHNLFDVVFW